MTSNTYAQVSINTKMVNNQNSFTYIIPKTLIPEIKIGSLVCVDFKNDLTQGIVMDLHNHTPSFKTKAIKSIIFREPLLTSQQISLIKEITDKYHTDYMSVIKLFVNLDQPSENNPQNINTIYNKSNINLTEDQKNALEIINKSPKMKFLIHGVTNSGKTEIYIRLAQYYLKQKKQVLILVPQISLTPQIIDRFENIFGKENIATYHSKITNYKKNINPNIPIIIGTRSSLFHPFTNLGIIIIDECHDSSYKQDKNPRYNAITVAEMISKLYNVKLILGSATPLIEQYYKSVTSQYELIKITKTVHQNKTINIRIINLAEEKNKSFLSPTLVSLIQQRIDKKEQSIIYLNRRGIASCLFCNNCKQSIKCKNCDLSLTLHKNILLCHHCEYHELIPNKCPNCNSHFLTPIGQGTQSIENQIKALFPKTNIARIDKDSIKNLTSLKSLYQDIKSNKVQIIIGTQSIAKGWDISNVTLVGIPYVDSELVFPDFRTTEQAYQSINQVIGRGGRNTKPTEIIIQTYMPSNRVLNYAIKADYTSFYKEELDKRDKLSYPPFTQLIKITSKHTSKDTCKRNIHKIYRQLLLNTKDMQDITIYQPIPSIYPFINRNYQMQLILKLKNMEIKDYRTILKGIYQSQNIIIDTEPFNLI